MTQDRNDKIHELAQELFQQDEGVQHLLEALIEKAMQAEANRPAARAAQRRETAHVQDAQRRVAF